MLHLLEKLRRWRHKPWPIFAPRPYFLSPSYTLRMYARLLYLRYINKVTLFFFILLITQRSSDDSSPFSYSWHLTYKFNEPVNGNNVEESHLFLVGTLHRLKTEQVKIAHACWLLRRGCKEKPSAVN